MFEKFTERARKVMSLSRKEAQRLQSEFIGTEHMLLGIVEEGGGVAAKVLKNMGVDLGGLRATVEKILTDAHLTPGKVLLGQLPFSPRARRAIELAGEAATQLGHQVIGTEHLLLGLLKETEGIAADALKAMGLRLDETRDMVLEVLGSPVEDKAAPAAAKPPQEPKDIFMAFQNIFGNEAKAQGAKNVFEAFGNIFGERMDANFEKLVRQHKEMGAPSESALSSHDKAQMVVDAWLAKGNQETYPNNTGELIKMIAWAIEAARRGA